MPDYRINVKIDPSQAVVGARRVDNELQRVGNTALRLRRLIAGAFAITGVTVGIGASLNTLRSFSQEISTVAAVTGATGQQFQQLSDRARELGATTRYTATNAAQALTLLGRGGFTVAESLASVDDTLALAQAGALDLATAAGITTSALRGFRISTDEASRVTDVLVTAANSANTNVVQLGEGLKFVAPVAAGLNVSLEETVAAMAALSDAGLQSTMAGTGLRRVLAELESPSTATQKIFKKLGVTADQVRVSQVGMAEALKVLRRQGIDTGKALEVFGQRGGPAFEVMSNAIPKVERLTKKYRENEGTALRVARIMDENLNGALFATQSAAEAVVLAFGQLGGQTFLTQFFRDLASTLRFTATNLEEVGQAFTIAGTAIVGFAAKAQLAAVGVHSFGDAVLFARLKLIGLEKVIARNPIGLLLIVLTTIISSLTLFRNEIDLGGGRLAHLGDVVTVIFNRIQNLLKPLVQNFRRGMLAIAELMGVTFGDIDMSLVGVVRAIAQTIDIIIGLFEGMFRQIGAVFKGGWQLIHRISSGAAGPLGKELELIGQQAMNAFVVGFNQSRLTDFLEGVVADAERLARERARQAGLGAPPGGVPEPTPVELEPPVPVATEQEALTLAKVVAGLEREAELLRMTNAQREIAVELDRVLEQLRKAKADVTFEDAAALQLLITRNRALAEQMQLIDRLRQPQDQYLHNLRLLNEAYKNEIINLEEYKELLAALKSELPKTTTLLGQQIESLEQRVGTVGLAFEQLAVGGVQVFTGALTEAIRTGSGFKGFIDGLRSGFADLLASIGEMILQMMVLRAVANLTGLPLVTTTAPGRQHGGSVQAGRPYWVGEEGRPELFVPSTSGRIIPSEGGMPTVMVQVVNVSDPDEVGNEINSGDHDERILNAVARNPRAFRAAIA